MTIKSGNYVWQISNSVGAGDFILLNNPTYVNFSAEFGIGINNKFYYGIHNRLLLEWEVGYGYMLDATTLIRESVLRSSNSNNLVTFSAGPKDIISDIPAQYQNYLPNFIYNETPSGTLDGVNLEFTLQSPFVLGTTKIFMNGLRLKPVDDYIESAPNKIIFVQAPLLGYTLLADYIKA